MNDKCPKCGSQGSVILNYPCPRKFVRVVSHAKRLSNPAEYEAKCRITRSHKHHRCMRMTGGCGHEWVE